MGAHRSDPPLDLSSHPSGRFTCHPPPAPHFDAFIDLDGDCLADLFLTCLDDPRRSESSGASYQVWTNDKDKGTFVFKREGSLPKGVKGITFADMGAWRFLVLSARFNKLIHLGRSPSRPRRYHRPRRHFLSERAHTDDGVPPLDPVQQPDPPLRLDHPEFATVPGSGSALYRRSRLSVLCCSGRRP